MLSPAWPHASQAVLERCVGPPFPLLDNGNNNSTFLIGKMKSNDDYRSYVANTAQDKANRQEYQPFPAGVPTQLGLASHAGPPWRAGLNSPLRSLLTPRLCLPGWVVPRGLCLPLHRPAWSSEDEAPNQCPLKELERTAHAHLPYLRLKELRRCSVLPWNKYRRTSLPRLAFCS